MFDLFPFSTNLIGEISWFLFELSGAKPKKRSEFKIFQVAIWTYEKGALFWRNMGPKSGDFPFSIG